MVNYLCVMSKRSFENVCEKPIPYKYGNRRPENIVSFVLKFTLKNPINLHQAPKVPLEIITAKMKTKQFVPKLWQGQKAVKSLETNHR